MGLNIIDFSNGIRPEEIQENFNYLQAQLSRERASVGGAGIASGLEVSFNITDTKFEVIVSDGNIIDNEGNEIFIPGITKEIQPPELYEYKEFCTLDEEKRIHLKHVPYALNRRRPAQYLSSFEPDVSGITIKYRNSINKDDYIRVRDISDTTLTVTGALKKDLEVLYKYSGNRIDLIYIDTKSEIVYLENLKGTTSTTPSAPGIPEDAQYLIAYVEIDSEYVDETDGIPHSWMYIRQDLRSIRNLYTDSDGTLYICNTSFDDLQIIHMKEPEDPKPNTLWLNLADNTLYSWRSTDEFIYKNTITISTDFHGNIDTADLTFSTDMSFLIGENELSVYLNGSELRRGLDYQEVGIDLPNFAGYEGEKNEKGNVFKILNTIKRPDEYEDILVPGDVITYVIRYKDSQYLWVPINKMNFINVKNSKVYSTYYEGINNKYIYEVNKHGDEKAYFDSALANSLGVDSNTNYPYKYQYFLFDRTKDMNMHFTPGKNELSIMINQMCLHEDQFEEITAFDIIQKRLPKSVLAAAATNFGWTPEYLDNNFNGIYDNSGIGFKLIEPLDSGSKADNIGSHYESYYGSNDLFVEAVVERRICAAPLNRKLERSATFVLEDTIKADENIMETRIVELPDVKYRYDESQLEVFVGGVKQLLGIDYIEEFGYVKGDIKIPPISEEELKANHDEDYYIRKKAAVCSKFKFLDNASIYEDSLITYKITTNVYSYDHINNILDDIGDILTDCKATVQNNAIMMEELRDGLSNRLEIVENQVKEFKIVTDEFMTKGSIIDIGQLPEDIVNKSIKSVNHINTSINLKDGKHEYKLKDIYPEDYVNVFHHKYVNNLNLYIDTYWIRGVHYEITEDVLNPGEYLIEIRTEEFNTDKDDDILYITGIKISNKRPK